MIPRMPAQNACTSLDARFGLATVLLGFDLQGWITLIAGLLLALITLFTGYDHVHVFWGPTLRLNQQVGISLLLASLAPLALVDEVFSVGVAQLASRRRVRDSRDRIRAQEDRAYAFRGRDAPPRTAGLQRGLTAV
ncbi:hypothetical protein H8F24_13835 [Synechococcus sp. CBW1002]|uniref:hypothetical protein n=1 Tax=Synechococcus sp. CBW1002 TaxID=1353134 RepID=UPI0018CCB4C3|nr:hypothetical protein [Synechococcus sp. CBW1002]QPN59153.1 hypothetical protein H8F24_13835 [Synechococcus sp. CBW1002]